MGRVRGLEQLRREVVEFGVQAAHEKWDSFCAAVRGLPEDEIRHRARTEWDGELSSEIVAALSRGEGVALDVIVKH